MHIRGRHYRTIFLHADGESVQVIDQTQLPFAFELRRLASLEDAAHAIRSMVVRGAPLIGITAAYGVALALRADPGDAALRHACATLAATRPTAVNLRWALERMAAAVAPQPPSTRCERAYAEAAAMADEDVRHCEAIGRHGRTLIESAAAHAGTRPVSILTHCNAGWLACVDWGTALAPAYAAHDAGIPVHVYVGETRPRNQGASLTLFELQAHGVPCTLIADNAAGHLMQRGDVDLCLVGSDRVTRRGDVANKIGTYLAALAARDNGVPFYVALPASTIDWTLDDGFAIPIEERAATEVTRIAGRTAQGEVVEIALAPDGTRAANPAFDVTPARLVTAIVTERGITPATESGLLALYPEAAASSAPNAAPAPIPAARKAVP